MQTRQPSTAAVEPKNEIVSRVSSTVITVRKHAAVVEAALEHQQPAMGLGRDLARDVIGADRRASVSARCTDRRQWIGVGEHEPRHAIGQRRLADALRAADQPGMRNSARCDRR